jgi:hypothetical protein
MENIGTLTILWRDQKSLSMFLDFLKTLYLPDPGTYGVFSGTLYDEITSLKESLGSFLKGNSSKKILMVMKDSRVRNMENLVLKEFLDKSQVVIAIQPGVLENLVSLKVDPQVSAQWEAISLRWKANIERLASR